MDTKTIERLTDDDLRRCLDREGMPRAIRLRELHLKMERGIGPTGRTYTLYDKTDRVLDWSEYTDDAPYNKPARGITLAEVDDWLDVIEIGEGFDPTPETLEVIRLTETMTKEWHRETMDRLVRTRKGAGA